MRLNLLIISEQAKTAGHGAFKLSGEFRLSQGLEVPMLTVEDMPRLV